MTGPQFGASGNYGADGVSIPFFSGAIKHLQKRHGKKMADPAKLEEFRAYLACAEAVFRTLPPETPIAGEGAARD